MTYCLAWKTDTDVYLVADSAETVEGGAGTLHTEISSFGEAHVSSRGRTVQEGLLKVIALGSVGVCFAGNIPKAMLMLATLRDALDSGHAPVDALQVVVNSHAPFGPDDIVHVLLAHFDEGPRLLALDTSLANPSVREVEQAQIGSIPEHLQRLSERVLAQMNEAGAQGEEFLVGMLAFVQAYGVHNVLLDYGVGGAYCGLRLDGQGLHWQPDLCYALHSSRSRKMQLVTTMVRDHGLVVYSVLAEQQRNFTNELSVPDEEEWMATWGSVAPLVSEGRFAYLCLLNKEHWNVTIVKMAGHSASRFARLTPATFGRDKGLNIELAPSVVQVMSTPVANLPIRFNWVPFEE